VYLPEVRELYRDAELHFFACEREGCSVLRMEYRSKRPFAGLAEGLIRGCLAYFGDSASLQRLSGPSADDHTAIFVLTR